MEGGGGAGVLTAESPVSRYRLLTQGDTIQADDEFLDDDCETWHVAQEGARLFVGRPYNPSFFQPMRRPLALAGMTPAGDTREHLED